MSNESREVVAFESPNCMGYVIHQLALDNGKENYISPDSARLKSLLAERLEIVDRIEDADAVAVVYGFANASGKWVTAYSHMAVVDKTRPGFVTEREKPGAPISRVPLEKIKAYYLSQGPEYSVQFLRVKPAPQR